MELKKLDARRGECNEKVLAFFPGTLDRIVDRLLEEDLPVNKGKITSYYGDICNSCFPNDSVVEAISRELSDIGSELYESRVTLSREILDFVPQRASLKGCMPQIKVAKVKCPTKDLYSLAVIQDESSGFSLKSLFVDIAGWLTSGLLGAAITVYDIYNSAKEAEAVANQMSPYMKKAIKSTGNNVQGAFKNTVDNAFSSSRKNLKKNQEQFKQAVYENY